MNKSTELCNLAFKYGTDKCSEVGHSYTPVYYELLKDRRNDIKKVLEIGVGSSKTMQWVPEHYVVGASLRMWRDFFPSAHIYGTDIDESAMFEDDRITTFLVNSADEVDMKNLISKIGSNIDLVIDDGAHSTKMQTRTANILMPLLNKDVLYIIEDAKNPQGVIDAMSQYNCKLRKSYSKISHDDLIIIENEK